MVCAYKNWARGHVLKAVVVCGILWYRIFLVCKGESETVIWNEIRGKAVYSAQ